MTDGFINYIRTRASRYHNATIRSVVKRFDHRDTLGATIAFADEREGERWICKCVVAERRVEDPAGGPQSRDKVTAGSTLPSMPLPPPPTPLPHPAHSLPRASLK